MKKYNKLQKTLITTYGKISLRGLREGVKGNDLTQYLFVLDVWVKIVKLQLRLEVHTESEF